MSDDSRYIAEAYELSDWLKEEHNTEKTAVKSGVICELFNVQKETLRSMVNFLRCSGVPVCSSVSGYWYSFEAVDIAKTLSHLEGRVKGINRAIAGLKQIQDRAGA